MSMDRHSVAFLRTTAPDVGAEDLEGFKNELFLLLQPGVFIGENIADTGKRMEGLARVGALFGPPISLSSGKVIPGSDLRGGYVGPATNISALTNFLLDNLPHGTSASDIMETVRRLKEFGVRHPDLVEMKPVYHRSAKKERQHAL